MNNPQPDTAPRAYAGDSTLPYQQIADPAERLEAAYRAQRLAEAKNISRRYTLMAAGVALVPIPLLNITAVLAIQVKLVHELSNLYNAPFDSKIAKPLLKSLLSCGAVSGGSLALIGLGMTVPGLRTLIGGGFSGGLAATTLATSEVFIRHFEAGGKLADFKPSTSTVPNPILPPASSASIFQSPELLSAPLEKCDAESNQSTPLQDVQSGTSQQAPEASDVERVYGIGVSYSRRLAAVGVVNCASLALMNPEELKSILGSRISLATARDFIAQAKSLANINSS